VLANTITENQGRTYTHFSGGKIGATIHQGTRGNSISKFIREGDTIRRGGGERGRTGREEERL
jgi:hypothetical protein